MKVKKIIKKLKKMQDEDYELDFELAKEQDEIISEAIKKLNHLSKENKELKEKLKERTEKLEAREIPFEDLPFE
jgi:hypothetical protein